MGDKQRCGYPLKNGGLCPGYVVKGDSRCLFHSELPAVREKLVLGRLAGAKKPERRQRLSARNLGFNRITSTKDLLNWVNVITRHYYNRQIDSETLKDLLALAAAFSKILETKEVSEEVERLKDMIEEMEGEDGEVQESEERDS